MPSAARSQCVTKFRAVERRDAPIIAATVGAGAQSILADVTECTIDAQANQRSLKPKFRLIEPRVRMTYAGGLPDANEDGELWVSRGFNVALRAGFSIDAGPFHATVAPELVSSTNEFFDHEAARDTSKSSFASPYNSTAGNSIDLPAQFGANPYRRITAGASAFWISQFGWSVGVSASPQQWGPGQRGSLLLGAAAAGIPRAFLRTAAPLATPIGVFDGVWFLGTVTESQFFDRNPGNDYRALSAFGLAWSPSIRQEFTIGAARGVMRSIDQQIPNAAQAFDALSATGKHADDLLSVFARLGTADSPLSAWVEVARNRDGLSAHSFFTLPYDAVSYIVGARGTTAVSHGKLVVLVEAANLEQGQDIEGQKPRDFYAGAAIPQGWTQRGRPIGHWVGPGGQTQFVSSDWVLQRARIGLFVERTRRNEDALFREFLPYPNRHDVSLDIGVRAAAVRRGLEFAVDASLGKRINFEFQNATYLTNLRTVDITTPRIRFVLTPVSQR